MTMSYQDALQRCLDALRAGEPLDAVIAAYPQFAAELREEVALTQNLQRLSNAVPAPDAAATSRAAALMNQELLAAQAAERRPRASFWGGFFVRSLAGGALVAVVALIAAGALFSGVFDNGGGAVEAATIEGIVVEAGAGTLTLQTSDGLASVQLDGATITDEDGAPLDATGLDIGEGVVIKARRIAAAKYAATQVTRMAVARLEAWCAREVSSCREAQERFQNTPACTNNPERCKAIIARVEELRIHLENVDKLQDLMQRCREPGSAVCQDLVQFCRQNADLCSGIRDRLQNLQSAVDGNLRERFHSMTERCTGGDGNACADLARFCTEHANLCPATAPLRPAASPTTTRPVTSPTTRPIEQRLVPATVTSTPQRSP
ncbi:MAG TPA: hypothetical protein VI759_06545 [Dehalococcoidia bacterium]|nr:hypothetical protein [Dehalococcoidia bacterium]